MVNLNKLSVRLVFIHALQVVFKQDVLNFVYKIMTGIVLSFTFIWNVHRSKFYFINMYQMHIYFHK